MSLVYGKTMHSPKPTGGLDPVEQERKNFLKGNTLSKVLKTILDHNSKLVYVELPDQKMRNNRPEQIADIGILTIRKLGELKLGLKPSSLTIKVSSQFPQQAINQNRLNITFTAKDEQNQRKIITFNDLSIKDLEENTRDLLIKLINNPPKDDDLI